MSEEALDQKIAEAWSSAGLDADYDGLDVPDEPDVAEVTEPDTAEADTESADDTDSTPDPAESTETRTESDDTVVEDATATEETPAVDAQQEQKAAEDELAAALGLGTPPDDPKKRAQWWKKQVPYSLIHKTVTEREKKLTDSHTKALTEHTTEFDTFKANVAKVEGLIMNDADHYLQTLMKMFPESYGKKLAPLFEPHQAKPLPEVAEPAAMPEPNYKLPDGSMTYDLDGIKQIIAWTKDEAKRGFLEEFKPHLDFVKKQRDDADKQARLDALDRQSQQDMQQVIAEVESWDMGKENLDAILAEARKLPETMNAMSAMAIAYNRVVFPKLKTSQDEMRAQLLKELKKTSAKKTAVEVAQTATTRTKEPSTANVDLDTRIKNAWKRKGLI